MEIETRDIPLKERDRYQMRLKSYHSELSKLEKDLVCFEFVVFVKAVLTFDNFFTCFSCANCN